MPEPNDEIQLLLSAYADGEVDETQRRRVEQALADDSQLQQRLDQYRRMDAACKGSEIADKLPAPAGAEWDQVWAGVQGDVRNHQSLGKQRLKRGRLIRRPIRLGILTTAAAAAALALALFVMFSSETNRGLLLPDSIAATTPECEAVADEHLRPVFYGENDTLRLYFVPPTAVGD